MLGLESKDFAAVLMSLIGFFGIVATVLAGKKPGGAAAKKESSASDVMEVAGAIVSDRKVNEWIAAAERLSEKLSENTETKKELGRKLDRNTEACDRMAAEIVRSAGSIDGMARQLEIHNRDVLRGGPTQF